MRRSLMTAKPEWQDAEPAALGTEARGEGSDASWEGSFLLGTATPVLGGGVDPFEPDVHDPVRLPAVRGQLRSWARALKELRPAGAADFEEEIRLWGGVGASAEEKGRASRVRLSVEIVKPGELSAAGVHKAEPGELPKAFPTWNTHNDLGYALFPLQRTKVERQRSRGADLQTRPWLKDLRFRLRVRVLGPLPQDEEKRKSRNARRQDLESVLGALWAWIHLGGLGARTRRGFGALYLVEPPKLDNLASYGDVLPWAAMFYPATIPAFLGALRTVTETGWRFRGAEALLQPRPRPATQAHAAAVGVLRQFRQGVGDGRQRGRVRNEGRSLWPEADLLRCARDELDRRESDRWAHNPDPGARTAWRAKESGAPRGAFGLPLEVGFKDQGDERASAFLRPVVGERTLERMCSPVILRPVVLRGNLESAFPLALVLKGERVDSVEIEFKLDKKVYGETVPVERSGGAGPPVSNRLLATRGDALAAFTSWLRDPTRGFQAIKLGKAGAP